MNRLQFDDFLRAINISKNDTYSLLLGAGCSITSDIPSAEDCILEWKKSIYKSNNSTASDWIENHRNPKVKKSIQLWLDNQGGYPERGNAEEYSFYAKKCYPIEEHRRQYFQKISWNSLNMYSQLPATISSSNDIARIGKLIDSNANSEYDYRYFI